MSKLRSDVAGNAGVLFVAAELSRRGLIAMPTVRNTEGVDLIAAEPLGGRSVSVQVKTSQSSQKKWLLNKKAERLHSPTLFYVFVNLESVGLLPHFHVVKSEVVATTVAEGHRVWLATPGRNGRARVDTDLRAFFDESSRYLAEWRTLGLSLAV